MSLSVVGERMKKFEGKKILFLGSNVGTSDMIRYAKANGAYTIVADFLPVEKSFGKQLSDGNVLLSTGDLDNLKRYIKDNKVDGVLAGVSEFNLLNAMQLCEYFGFPFYCTKEQWDKVENKEHFRGLCEEYGVPCPHTFFVGENPSSENIQKIEYPVIVKPVDGSASIGITICRDESNLLYAIKEAKDNSEKGKVIIEEFAEGEEFAAHYTIASGNVSLSCVDNRVPVAVHEGDVTTIPVARVYPSTFINEYILQVNPYMLKLCQSLNLNTGVVFVQGLYNKRKNSFYIFEAGLRCAGEGPYRLIERVNGVSFMNNLVDYALLKRVTDFDQSKENPFFNGKVCCVTSCVSKGGRVGKIVGFKEVARSLKSVIDSECRYHEGDETPNGNTLRQIMIRYVLITDSIKQLVSDIEYINNSVKVLDEKGHAMCLTFDARSYFNLEEA